MGPGAGAGGGGAPPGGPGGPAGQTDRVARTVGSTVRGESLDGDREVQGMLPPSPFQAPRTSINRAISPTGGWPSRSALADVRRVDGILGGTVNDVVLAVVAGAVGVLLRDGAEELEQLPGGHGAGVGPSPAKSGRRWATGYRPLLVSLATGVGDPAAPAAPDPGRDAPGQGTSMRAVGSRVSALGPGPVPGGGHPGRAAAVTNLRPLRPPSPIFNVIVGSNVPGPDFPLYLAGARDGGDVYPSARYARGWG